MVNDDALAARAAHMLQRTLARGSVMLVGSTAPGGSASEAYLKFVGASLTQSVDFGIGGYATEAIAR